MPRINFRRNYQKTYRKIRLDYTKVMSLKFTYQKQLTRYLKKFYSLINNQLRHSHNYFKLETTLSKILLFSHLVPDPSTVHLFLSKRLISCNNLITTNPNLILYKNDIVSISISTWYYVYMRWSES
jgi:hypothetical protein